MEYLKTLSSKENSILTSSAELLLAAIEKENGLDRYLKIFTENQDNYLGESALYQWFMFQYNEKQDIEKSRFVLDLLDYYYTNSRLNYEAHKQIGDEVESTKEFYSKLPKGNFVKQVITDLSLIPEEYELKDAYPNPFNPYLQYHLSIHCLLNLMLSVVFMILLVE